MVANPKKFQVMFLGLPNIIIKNLFKVGYNNIVYSKNRATNLNQLFTKILYLQFQLITYITITIISIP